VRILFLDIDGVLNRTGFSPPVSQGLRSWIEPELAARLQALLEETKTAIVLSSDWRRGRTCDELRAELTAAGITAPLHDVTPVLHRERWREIQHWLDQHVAATRCISPLTHFAIVDDGYDMGALNPYFVRTSPLAGLDEAAAAKLRTLLRATR
jgi:hypothetical protein